MSDRSQPLSRATAEPPATKRDEAGRVDFDAYRRCAASLRQAATGEFLRAIWRILTVQPESTRRRSRRSRRPRLHVAEEIF